MTTLVDVNTTDVKVGVIRGLVLRFRNKAASLFSFLAVLAVVTPGAANAAPPANTDLLNGAGTSFFSSITGYLTGTLVPAVLLLAAVVIGIGMLIKYGRKATSS